MDLLSGASNQRLEGAIKAASLRQQVLSNNIANVDTPNFKRSDVLFEDLLSQAMGTGNASGARTPAPSIVTEQSTRFNNSGNNVDIDREMSLLAENQLRYNFYIQQINHNIKMLNIGIKGQ